MSKRLALSVYLSLAWIYMALGCTSAIIGADMNPYGRPLLWKNRDTSALDNKIEYVPAHNDDFAYVALFNSTDTLLREAWIGMNEYGFAVMNTASYNLKDDSIPQKDMDKEGFIMTKALKKCKTVDDFALLLDTIERPMGVEANFGVIDAYGNGAYFETDNFRYKRFNLEDSPNHVLIRTNYSYSGRPEEGFGFIREANAEHLLEPYINNKNITPEVLTEGLSKSFWHSLFKEDFSTNGSKWIIDQDFIPRYTSTATIVVEGCKPLNPEETINPDFIKNQYIMWTGLGYPPCSEIFPVFCTEEGVDNSLKGNPATGKSPQCDLVLKRKAEVFPYSYGNGNKYIDITRLFNDENTGYVQTLVPENFKTYSQTRLLRDK